MHGLSRASKRDDPRSLRRPGARFVRRHPGRNERDKVIVPGKVDARASWCAGWPIRMRIAGCRSRTSRFSAPQQELVRRWIDAGAPRRQCPITRQAANSRARCLPRTRGSGRAVARRRDLPRRSSSPGQTSNAQGGALAVSAADRPAAGGDGPGVPRRRPAAGGRDLRPGRACGTCMTAGPRRRSPRFPVRFTPWRSVATDGGWPSGPGCRRARAWCGSTPSPTAR